MNKAVIEGSESWDLVLKPKRSFFDVDLRDIWRYRDLLWLFVRRDFVSFYKQTILGPLWFFIQPLFTTVIYTFIFGGLANIPTDGIHSPAVFYMAGITLWNYFSDCITKTSTVFKDNTNIFGKVYFPRIVMPLSLIISNLIRFAVQLVLFLLTMAFFYWVKGDHSFYFTPYVALFPLVVVLMALQGLGLGMIVSAMTTRYRDLAFLVIFGVQLLMYATTVIYPFSSVFQKYGDKHPVLVKVIEYNPMTAVIETFRIGFLGHGTFSWGMLGYSTAVTILIMILGVLTFNKAERSFVDTI
jgi:lipopolysaccharide transport system permease protein